MTIGTLCNHNVVSVSPHEGVAEAAKKMRDEHVGDLIVAELRGGRLVPVGILTDRDLVVEVIAQGVEADELTVKDIMSTDLLTVTEDNGLEFVLRKMSAKGVRRVPVVDTAGTLVGVLSVDDVIEHIAGIVTSISAGLRNEQRGEKTKRP